MMLPSLIFYPWNKPVISRHCAQTKKQLSQWPYLGSGCLRNLIFSPFFTQHPPLIRFQLTAIEGRACPQTHTVCRSEPSQTAFKAHSVFLPISWRAQGQMI